MRNNTGIQASRTENNQIGLFDLLPDFLFNFNIMIITQPADIPYIPADSLFSEIFSFRAFTNQIDLFTRQWKYCPFNIQKLTHIFGCFRQISLQINQGCKHNVSHRMIIQGALFKAVA